MNLFVLIDSRHEPQNNDLEFMQHLGENSVPFVIIFTEADKLTKKQLKENIAHYTSELLKTWEEVPKYFISSAVDKSGQKEILDFISETNMLFQN